MKPLTGNDRPRMTSPFVSDQVRSEVAHAVDPATRTAFTDAYRLFCAQVATRNMFAALTLFLAFIFWDWIVSPETFQRVLPLRIAAGSVFLLFMVFSRIKNFYRYQSLFFVLLFSVAGMTVAWILLLTTNGFQIGITGVVLCIAAAAAIFRTDVRTTAIAGVIVIAGTIILMLHGDVPPRIIASNAIFVGTIIVFAIMHNRDARDNAFLMFLYQKHLEDEKSRAEALVTEVTTMRAEREQWLENLARFLRHELRNQVTATETSVKLAGTTGSTSPGARSQRYLDRASRSLQRMRSLVETATEATSLEAALSAEEIGPVDLAMLIAERGQAFRESHAGKKFELLLPSSLVVRGSDVRLGQLIDKLLGNAVEHTPEGGCIKVALSTNGTDAALTIENEGDALPDDKVSIFDPYFTTGTEADNTGLGLYVVKVIAEGHGGEVRAYDLDGTQGAGFEVRLPADEGA